MMHVEDFTAEIGTERADFDAMLRKVEEIPAGRGGTRRGTISPWRSCSRRSSTRR